MALDMDIPAAMHDFLCALPKCEHHIHIEGSLSPSLLFSLSRKNGIPLPSVEVDAAFASEASLEERYTRFSDLQDFLDYYYLAMSTLLTASDFEDLMYAYLGKAVADGCLHAEIFFDPQAHTSRGVALETVVRGLRRGIARAEAEWDVSAELIMCFLRHLPGASAVETFNDARDLGLFPSRSSKSSSSTNKDEEDDDDDDDDDGDDLEKVGAKDRTIVGIGLDSAELPFPPELFRDVYALAGEVGLRRTAHAGEEGPASYIATALDTLHVSRIDHGIRLCDDPDLLARVAREGTLLTVCPLSNVRLRAVPEVKDVPIRTLLAAGVRFSLNSDDPAYFGGYLLDNYLAVQRAHTLTKAEWLVVAENGIRGSWCSRGRKREMLAKLTRVSEDFADL